MEESNAAGHKIVKYKVFVYVWAALVALTWLTINATGFSIMGFTIAVPMAIAAVKATLVAYFFMHLRYEKGFLKIMIFIAIGTLAIVTWLVFGDVAYR